MVFMNLEAVNKELSIEGADVRELYGAQDVYLEQIRSLSPKVKLVARGSSLRVLGAARDVEAFERKMNALVDYYVKYGHISKEVVAQAFSTGLSDCAEPVSEKDVIVFGNNGAVIRARTVNQRRMTEMYESNDLLFAVGPAGSGKTYTAIALAVRALKERTVKRVILTRPAVEAGEKLGFLPGDMKDKIDPYLQPLYDALEDMIPAVKLKEYMETNVIQIAPLAFMRGRTLNDAVIVLDEAQNTTVHQIKMFLTRLGMNAKMIITGDATQIDLPRSVQSGLVQALHILRGVPGIGRVEFGKKDIVRHSLVQRIVEAYERHDKEEMKSRPEQMTE